MKKRTIQFLLIHLCFWAFNMWREPCPSLFSTLAENVILSLAFYFNYFVLVPKIFKSKKPRRYLIWLLVLFALYCVTMIFAWHFHPETQKKEDILLGLGASIYIAFYYGGISTALRLGYDWVINEDKNFELITQKTNAQVQFMKSNVNIPFIVEALTYLEHIAHDNPSNVKEPLLLLSNVLRYGTYDAAEERIEVEKEIGVMEEFVALINEIEKNYQISLHTDLLTENTSTVPNLMVRILSFWRQELSSCLVGVQNIHIKSTPRGCEMKLPAFAHLDLSFLSTNYPEISSALFQTRYSIENQHLLIEINPTCNEYKLPSHR